MAQNDPHQQHKTFITNTFNAIAENYDCPQMRYFASCAEEMIRLSNPAADSHICDIAAGTGQVSLAAARHIDRQAGRIEAIDLSTEMLAIAARSMKLHAINNVNLQVMDAEHLTFADSTFDLLCCSFGIFFLPEPLSAVNSWHRVLKPGGQIIISSFAPAAFMPMAEWLKEDIEAVGVDWPGSPQRFRTERECLSLFDRQRFQDHCVTRRQQGIHLMDEQEWWHILNSSGYRGLLNQLAPPQLADLKQRHLGRLAEIKTPKGIWLDVEVIYTQAWKTCT